MKVRASESLARQKLVLESTSPLKRSLRCVKLDMEAGDERRPRDRQSFISNGSLEEQDLHPLVDLISLITTRLNPSTPHKLSTCLSYLPAD